MIRQYFNIYNEKVKEYGEKTAVLFQVGSFFEIYQVDNEKDKIGNAYTLSKITNTKYANKLGDISKNSMNYPNFIGFNVCILNKYLSIILDNDYTVVMVTQLENGENKKDKLVKREVTAVYSSSLQPPDFELSCVNILLSIYVEHKRRDGGDRINCSIISINNSTNKIEILEKEIEYTKITQKLNNNILDGVLNTYFPKEVLVKIKCDDKFFCDLYNYFKQYYQIPIKIEKVIEDDIFKSYNKLEYQNEYFKKVYDHINFGLVQPIEYLGLITLPTSIINFMYIIDFIGKHDLKYISNLNIPVIIKENNNLILELNTLYQLNIHNQFNNSCSKSIFNIIDFTSTAIGKRYLKNILCKPLKDPLVIDWRYKISEELETNDKLVIINKVLDEIIDFERLHRKMGLLLLHPFEFVKLNKTYKDLLKIINYLKESITNKDELFYAIPDDKLIENFKEYVDKNDEMFDYDIMINFDLNTKTDEISNYFRKGMIKELDTIQLNINKYEKEREDLRVGYDKKINKDKGNVQMVKLVYTENDGYSFVCTKIRYHNLCKEIGKESTSFKTKITNNIVKFYPEEMVKLSNKIINNRELLNKKTKLNYIEYLSKSYDDYNNNDVGELFCKLKEFIEIIDITLSNIKCKNKYNYCRPEIRDEADSGSFIKAKKMRHPLIERICDTEYIPNNISLTKEKNGALLYGVNSSGKSSLLRAIGVNTIMAQCGLYVACEEFVYFPFNTVISQVDLTDDLYSGKSSFINEMIGLKKILSCSNKNTLILCDEMSKGTEPNSSVSLVTSTILRLITDKSKFFFTSHLHEIPKLKEIVECKNLNIYHLGVSVVDDDIIFRRKIEDGSGSDLYGLEISKNILDDPLFTDTAYKIRNKLVNNKTSVLGVKKSVYNKKKILSNCEICKSTKSLETHHCNFQKDADSMGFIKDKSFHKNSVFNLICLCKECHLKVTLNKIVINGYMTSTKGKILDYFSNDGN